MAGFGIRKNEEFFDLNPGQLKRERNNPFFLTDIDGTSAIPGDYSFPFNLPLTDKNARLLNYPNMLQADLTFSQDVELVDETGVALPAKLNLAAANLHLNIAKASQQSCYLLMNSSAFFMLIKDKKMSELSLGGTRTFSWTGFSTTTGFWGHVHSTWNYADCTSGDYVFYPVMNEGYLGYSTFMNRPYLDSGVLKMHPENVTSLCPHVYVVYIIKQIFAEHGYTVSGAILSDPDFMKLTLLSLMGVYWSDMTVAQRAGEDYLPADPLSTIEIKLGEHMPPTKTIGEFLVSLCNLLPLGFSINDRSKHCEIVTYKAAVQSPDRKEMKRVAASLTRNIAEDTGAKIFGIKREFTNDALPNLSRNLYGGRGGRFDTTDYLPTGATDFITNDMTPLASRPYRNNSWLQTETGAYHPEPYYVPEMEVEGNWHNKEEVSEWGFRVMFYRGKDFPLNEANTLLAPYATHQPDRWRYGMGGFGLGYTLIGNWALTFDKVGYGTIDYWWKDYLNLLGKNDIVNARWFVDFHEYADLPWSAILQLQNVNFFLRKVTELLPYPGYVDVELQRVP